MDLIAKGPNGRLDAMAACMLLWSGAITFGQDGITWDGTSHQLGKPTIDKIVVSLYRLRPEDIEAALPDLFDLLGTLERDEALRLPSEHLSDGLREVLPTGMLTGMTLFLLQANTHPLIVELVDRRTLRVRYDRELARSIPELQGLLCRLLCHLRCFRGDEGSFDVLFVQNDVTHGARSIIVCDECVVGAIQDLDERVEVSAQAMAEVAPLYEHATSQSDESPELATSDSAELKDATTHSRMRSLLEESYYTTGVLHSATKQRIEQLDDTHEKLQKAQPSATTSPRKNRTAPGLTTNAKAARSLAVRSAFYIAIGVVCMLLGRKCLTESDQILRIITDLWQHALNLASDFVSLTLGQAQAVGNHVSVALPLESLAGILRVVGFALMGAGILFPLLKILKYKRRIDRELSLTRSHQEFFAELYQKQQVMAETTQAEALATWASNMASIEEELALARDSLQMLEEADRRTQEALEACGGAKPAKTYTPSHAAERTAMLSREHMDAAQSEEERHARISSYCDEVDDLVARALHETRA